MAILLYLQPFNLWNLSQKKWRDYDISETPLHITGLFSHFISDIWDSVLENGPSKILPLKIFKRLSSTIVIWSILEYTTTFSHFFNLSLPYFYECTIRQEDTIQKIILYKCPSRQMFLKISLISQENTCVGVFYSRPATLLKRGSNTSIL